MVKHIVIILINIFLFTYSIYSADMSSSKFQFVISGLFNLNIFNFEDGTTQDWYIHPDGRSVWDGDQWINYNSCTNIWASTTRKYNGSYSLAIDINCSRKHPVDGALAGNIRFTIPGYSDLSGKTKYVVRYWLEHLTGDPNSWDSDWLCIQLFLRRTGWDFVWGSENGSGWVWTNTTTSWGTITWDISGYARDYITEVGFELKGGKNTVGTARLYIDLIEFQP